MFCNSFYKNVETVVAENSDIDRDMHTYAYAYFDTGLYRSVPLHFMRGLSMQYS